MFKYDRNYVESYVAKKMLSKDPKQYFPGLRNLKWARSITLVTLTVYSENSLMTTISRPLTAVYISPFSSYGIRNIFQKSLC
ncbi:hypothetical protein [Salegentibacter lacus]|uniref:hypothetical protein n=1 Tax=Salegentibacter lacus TaxID=2873599 RepID=UPI003742A76C